MAEAKKPDPKPITDVAKPGKSAPSGNSKSVLISNRPLLKDPMVVTTKDDDDPEVGNAAAETTPGMEATAPTLAPSKETEVKATAEAAKDVGKPADKTDDTATDKPEPEAAEAKPPADKPADKKPEVAKPSTNEEASEKDDSDDPTSLTPEAVDAEAAKQAEHDAAIQKLVDGKQYFLPINSVEKRKTKRFIILGLVLSIILVAAWADVALDAGLIHVSGVKPVTHFFSN